MPPVEFSPISTAETQEFGGRASRSSFSSFIIFIALGVFVLAVTVIVTCVIRWIYKLRKYNKLRHRLIPTYSFDPNEEENWDTET